MYDRHRVLGGYPDRPLMTGARPEARPAHVHGGVRNRHVSKADRAKAEAKRVGILPRGTKDG